MKLLISLFLSILFVLIGFSKPLNICIASRVGASLPAYKTAIYDAARLATEKYNIDVKLTPFFYKNPLDPIRVYDKMIEAKCDAVIGYEYLTDVCLLEKNRKINIPIFSLYGSNYKKSNIVNNIFFLLPSYYSQAKDMLGYMKSDLGLNNKSKILLLTNVSSESMKSYGKAYQHIFRKEQINYKKIKFADEDKDIIYKALNELKKDKYDFIIILSSSAQASEIINGVDSNKYTYIGTDMFGSSVAPTLLYQLKKTTNKIYFVRNIDTGFDKSVSLFNKEYCKEFNIDPLMISLYAYDAVNVIIKSYSQFGFVAPRSIDGINYDGVSGINISKHKYNQSAHFIVLKVGKDGYEKKSISY